MERALLFGATLALAWVGQGLLQAEPPHFLAGAVLLTVAAGAFVSLPRLMNRGPQENSSTLVAAIQRLFERVPGAGATLIASVVCGGAAHWLNINPAMQPWPALSAWAAAIGLLLLGASKLSPPQLPFTKAALKEMRWELIGVLGLAALALVLRAVALDSIPRNFGGDEGEMGTMARAVIGGTLRDPFATGWLSHPTLWFFLQALSLNIFGNTIFGLRMLSALIGAATIPALYVFARPLYGRPIALAATALLVFYHFHIHFSRLAINNIVDPLAALVAFTAFLHGYRTRSPFSFAVSGVTLGVAQHFYMGSRLTPLVIVAVLLHQLLLDRQHLLSLRWHLALLSLGFMLGFGPLASFFVLHPQDFTARIVLVGIFQTGWFDYQLQQGMSPLQILSDQARNAFGAFTFRPDRSTWYDPGIPLLDQVSSVLFVLGLAVTITRWRRPESAVLLAWLLGVGVFGGMMMVNAPESPRYVTSIPVICLFIALAIEQLGTTLRWALPVAGRYMYALGVGMVVLLSLWSVNFYFREYTPRQTYGWFNSEIATAIGRYLHDQREPVFVYFFGPPYMYYGNGSIRFQAPDVQGMDILQPLASADELVPPPDGLRPIFIFLPARAPELEAIKLRYPNGMVKQVDASSQDAPLMVVYAPK